MDGMAHNDLLSRYQRRPAKRSGDSLQVMRARLRQSLAITQLEGFEPTAQDLDALELLATGRIDLREYDALCLHLTTPTLTPLPAA